MIVSEFDRACVECEISASDNGYMTLKCFLSFQRLFEVKQILKYLTCHIPCTQVVIWCATGSLWTRFHLMKTINSCDRSGGSFTRSRVLRPEVTLQVCCITRMQHLSCHIDLKIKAHVLILIEEQVLIYVPLSKSKVFWIWLLKMMSRVHLKMY